MEVTPEVTLNGSKDLSTLLDGYYFYIDAVDDEERDEVEIVAGKIVSLGGKLRTSLSRGVCVITANNLNQRRDTRTSGRFLKQNETRAKKKIVTENVRLTTVDRAKKLGLSVCTVQTIRKWFREVEQQCTNMEDAGSNRQPATPASKTTLDTVCPLAMLKKKKNVIELKVPYIKYEDKAQRYEPQFLELLSTPTICFETAMPRSPFPMPRPPFQERSIHSGAVRKELSSNAEVTIDSTSNYGRSGYCDFCACFFRYRDRHIQSKKHQHNIPFENFKKLDQLIGNGERFNDFINTIAGSTKSLQLLKTMEDKKKLRDFLKTMEEKKKSRDYLKGMEETKKPSVFLSATEEGKSRYVLKPAVEKKRRDKPQHISFISSRRKRRRPYTLALQTIHAHNKR